MEKNMKKPHKYSVGDEFKFRITGVREQDDRIVYDIEGLNILSLTENVVDRFPKLIKPGDTVYMVYYAKWDNVVVLDEAAVEDVGTKEVKILGDWQPMDETIFFDLEQAQEQAVMLAKRHGVPIDKRKWTLI